MKAMTMILAALTLAPIAQALPPFVDECEPVFTAEGEEPCMLENTEDSTTEISTYQQALAQLIDVVNGYVNEVFQTAGLGEMTAAEIDDELMATAASERAARAEYYADISTDYQLLEIKLRLLAASHPLFGDADSFPADVAELIAQAFELEQQDLNHGR